MSGDGKRYFHPWLRERYRHLGSRRMGGTRETLRAEIDIHRIQTALVGSGVACSLIPRPREPNRTETLADSDRLRGPYVSSAAANFTQAFPSRNPQLETVPQPLLAAREQTIHVFSVQLYPCRSTGTRRYSHHAEPAQSLERAMFPPLR